MAKARPPHDTSEDLNDSPIAWFAELVLAYDRQDIDRFAEAKVELARLGWNFRYHKPRPEAKGKEVPR